VYQFSIGALYQFTSGSDTIELCGGEQALYCGSPFAGAFAAGKQPVLLAQFYTVRR
jgi:hypothetical protein